MGSTDIISAITFGGSGLTKSLITPKLATRKIYSDEPSKDLLRTLKEVFEKNSYATTDRIYVDLTKHLYSSIRPFGFTMSGSECAERLFAGVGDSQYTIPTSETSFVKRNGEIFCDYLRERFPEKHFTHVSLGCGPYMSIMNKDLLLARVCGVTNYTSVDINKQFAEAAASLIAQRESSIKTAFMHEDFSKVMKLKNVPKGHIPLLSMFGNTLGQYPLTDSYLWDGGMTLRTLMENLSTTTNHSGILFATLDIEQIRDNAETMYSGTEMRQLMSTLWGTVREVAQDEAFDPHVFKYIPEYDSEQQAVLFVHRAVKETSLCIEGNVYKIPKGMELVIGCAQKSLPEQVLPICREAGWVPANIPFQHELHNTGCCSSGQKHCNAPQHQQ